MKAQARRRSRSAIDRKRTQAFENGKDAYLQKRREIARAAAEVFNRKGFRGTSVGAVADALGMSRASLYYYIPDKHTLFDELITESIESNVTRAEEIRAAEGSAVEKIRMMIVDIMRISARNYPLLYLFLRENLSQVAPERTEWSRHVRGLNRRYEQILIAIIEEGVRNGELRPVASPRLMAYGIFGMTGWTSRWFDPKTSLETAEEIGAAFAEMVLSGIRTEPAEPARTAGGLQAAAGELARRPA
jgi:AcrR family transcriptional regulator